MTGESAIVSQLRGFAAARVLSVGDVMLDRFIYGEVTRVSPEAPIPICRVTREVEMLGGAGNVVRNLVALGAHVDFLSVVGDDAAGTEIETQLLKLVGVSAALQRAPGRVTTVKSRYVAGGQQLMRADRETDRPIPDAIGDALVEAARARIPQAGAVILSDYGKGALTPKVIAGIVAAARAANVPVLIDPKGADYEKYAGATVLTPNLRELAEASRAPVAGDGAIADAARKLIAEARVANILVTRSADGMSLIDAATMTNFPAEAREVFDVSGAGDTVIATLAAGIAAKLSLPDAARLANVAAGIVVGKAGTAVAHADDIVAALRASEVLHSEEKSVSLAVAADIAETRRARKLKIGFTNGCFDLIHPGHVSLLRQARAACDFLVVGLNSDASVKRLKGETRPVQSEAARAAVLGSLTSVDLIVIFEDDTPLTLIEALKPDVLVKGADYSEDQVVGADVVKSYGGKIVLAELTPGASTTATIARMAK